METEKLVDALAQEIRRVDGNHTLGAGALAEALAPFVWSITPDPAVNVGAVVEEALDQPAQVGGVVFRTGVSHGTVIRAAQRHYAKRHEDDGEPSAREGLLKRLNSVIDQSVALFLADQSPDMLRRYREALDVLDEERSRALTPPQSGKAGGAETPSEQTPSPSTEVVLDKGVVYVEVYGLTGTGKSAVMGEIEIALKAIGLTVEHDTEFQSEKNMTHADWQWALDLYKPTVRLRERNVPPAATEGSAE